MSELSFQFFLTENHILNVHITKYIGKNFYKVDIWDINENQSNIDNFKYKLFYKKVNTESVNNFILSMLVKSKGRFRFSFFDSECKDKLTNCKIIERSIDNFLFENKIYTSYQEHKYKITKEPNDTENHSYYLRNENYEFVNFSDIEKTYNFIMNFLRETLKDENFDSETQKFKKEIKNINL